MTILLDHLQEKLTQPHLRKQLGFMCVYTAANVDWGHPYNLGEEWGKA